MKYNCLRNRRKTDPDQYQTETDRKHCREYYNVLPIIFFPMIQSPPPPTHPGP